MFFILERKDNEKRSRRLKFHQIRPFGFDIYIFEENESVHEYLHVTWPWQLMPGFCSCHNVFTSFIEIKRQAEACPELGVKVTKLNMNSNRVVLDPTT